MNHPVRFIINSLNLTGIATLSELKPSRFLFKTFKSQSGNEMLQLFIQTNLRERLDYSQTFISSDVPDPIPEGAESSLIINSRIFFGSVLPESLMGGWTFKGNNPGDPSLAWNGSVSSGSVQGNVVLDITDRRGGNRYSYEPYFSNPQSWKHKGYDD